MALVAPLFAQYDAHLVGHVLDENTGEHLPYVNVQLKGTNTGTITIELVEKKTIELKAVIHELPQQLNTVVVTANRYATKRQETATIVNVLSP